jgi:hypothetical protein
MTEKERELYGKVQFMNETIWKQEQKMRALLDEIAALNEKVADGVKYRRCVFEIDTPPNARFWNVTPCGEFVKLTLKYRQTAILKSGGPTDEGYSNTTEQFEHIGYAVICRSASSGSDCDGRHASASTRICELNRLKSGYRGYDETQDPDTTITFPAWRELTPEEKDDLDECADSNFDQFAEACNY